MVRTPSGLLNAWVVIALGALTGCSKRDPSEAPAKPATQAASNRPTPIAPAAAPASALPPPEPPTTHEAEAGAWVESFSYFFRYTRIQRCPLPANAPPDMKLRLAITVDVKAKYNELLVAPRDVKLVKDGVILESEMSSAGCGTQMSPKQLRQLETHSGLVTFLVPDEAFARSANIVYQATRWGGAPPIIVKMPECLDACRDAKSAPAAAKGSK